MRPHHYPASHRYSGHHYPDLQDPSDFLDAAGLQFSRDEHEQPEVFIEAIDDPGGAGLNKLLLLLQPQTSEETIGHPSPLHNLHSVVRDLLLRTDSNIPLSQLLRAKLHRSQLRPLSRQIAQRRQGIPEIVHQHSDHAVLGHLPISDLHRQPRGRTPYGEPLQKLEVRM